MMISHINSIWQMHTKQKHLLQNRLLLNVIKIIHNPVYHLKNMSVSAVYTCTSTAVALSSVCCSIFHHLSSIMLWIQHLLTDLIKTRTLELMLLC